MRVDDFLSRLQKVKRTRSSNWIACCPAHKDKHPSLTIAETPDERVLIHCFAGCSTEEILKVVGMEFKDLFPEKLMERGKPYRRPFPAADVLEALSNETLIVHITANRLANGESLMATELERLRIASQRIMAGRDLANG